MSDWDFKPIEEKKTEDAIKENPSEAEGQSAAPAAPEAGAVPQDDKEASAAQAEGGELPAGRADAETPQQGPKEEAGAGRNTGDVPPPYQNNLPYPYPYQHGGYGPGYRPPYGGPQQPGYYGAPYPPGNGYPMPPYPPQGNAWPPQQGGYPPPKKEKLSTGLKVFLWIMGILIGALLIGFAVYGIATAESYRGQEDGGVSSSPVLPLPEDGDGSSSENEESSDVPEDDGSSSVPVIPNTEGIQIESHSGEEKSAKEIYQSIAPSLVGVVATPDDTTTGVSQGSGIIASADGYIITNAHVVLNTRNIDVKIIMYDDTEHDAVVVGYDKTTDLAVLKMNPDEDLVPAVFGDSDELSVGDWVLAIGNPGGIEFSSSLTRGIVSAVNRRVGSNSDNGMTYIQTDAAINPGNSGGALVNMYGQVIGINSSKIVASGYEGMGFAIPITQAKEIIDDLMANGYVAGRTRLGITGSDVTQYDVWQYDVPLGFQIASIDADSAFSGTEAQVGDIITAIDGTTVTGLTDITNVLSGHKPGDEITVTLYRQGGRGNDITLDVTVTLLEDKGETQTVN